MSHYEKQAWFNLAIVVLAMAAFLALLPWGARGATGAFGVLGVLGLSPFWGRAGKARADITTDERDHSIQVKSGIIAYHVFWLIFVGSSMGIWALALYRTQAKISVDILPFFPVVGWLVFTLAQSIATIVQYERGK